MESSPHFCNVCGNDLEQTFFQKIGFLSNICNDCRTQNKQSRWIKFSICLIILLEILFTIITIISILTIYTVIHTLLFIMIFFLVFGNLLCMIVLILNLNLNHKHWLNFNENISYYERIEKNRKKNLKNRFYLISKKKGNTLVMLFTGVCFIILFFSIVGFSLIDLSLIKIEKSNSDMNPDTHELIIKENIIMTEAVFGYNRNTTDLDKYIENIRENATENESLYIDVLISRIQSFADNEIKSKTLNDIQQVDITFKSRQGDSLARSILLGYICYKLNIPFQIVSYMAIRQGGLPGHEFVKCYIDYILSDFIESYEDSIAWANDNVFSDESVDYVILWNLDQSLLYT